MVDISLSENLSRFLFYKREFNEETNTVKYSAFLPNRNGETSVFRTSTLEIGRIWEIGSDVSKQRKKTFLGRGIVFVTDVVDSGLNLEGAKEGEHPLHANIIGWALEKERKKLAALKLAARAQLSLPPSTLNSNS